MSSSIEDPIEGHHLFEVFNGFRVIEAHLAERAAVESYVQGSTDACEVREEVCHPACLFGQWLHGAEEKLSEHLPLFNTLCKHCELVYETAMQAVLLKKLGDEVTARALLEEYSRYTDASSQFQHQVFLLHDKLHERYRREDA